MTGSGLAGGRYRFDERLSSTPMSEVWLAADGELARRVVVKLLAPGADRERFVREARAVAALSHPHIVHLFDFGDEGRPYMVFEYLPGGSLDDRLAPNTPLGRADARRIAKDIASGLAHAHERGVVHRDLKPGNILFDLENRGKIADFGIARVQGTDTLTDAGTLLGTAAYMSPEQVRGESATPASDVYAFGVILYRMLGGHLPFEAESLAEVAEMHREAPPPPLGRDDRRLEALAALAFAALAKEPSSRPADGTALVQALDRAERADLAATQVVRPPNGSRRRGPRGRLVAGFGVALVASAGVLAAVLLTNRPASAPAVPLQQSLPARRTHAATENGSTAVSRAAARSTSVERTSTTTAARTATATTSAPPPPSVPAPPSSTAAPPTDTATPTTAPATTAASTP